MSPDDDIGEVLLAEQLITPKQLEKTREDHQHSGRPLEEVVVALGYVNERDLVECLGKRLGVEFVDLEQETPSLELMQMVPEHLARRHRVLPVSQHEGRLLLAMADPSDVLAIDDLRLVTGLDITPAIAMPSALLAHLERATGGNQLAEVDETITQMSTTDFEMQFEEVAEEEMDLQDLQRATGEAPIVRIVNLIISQAINDKASDIHIEADERSVRVRFRVDGILHEVMSPPKNIHSPMVSRIKIMANLDIAERRLPQDGKIHLHHDGRAFDLRVSTVPTVHGEKTVMRILDKGAVMLGLNKLGFYDDNLHLWESLVEKPYGMLLVTGPTGSGKSTTLYSCLNRLNCGEKNLMTCEDPVEYQLPGVNQVQTNAKAGLTFAKTLRSFLRQDPDIIMVGEIRDAETAKIAVEAALTGHLVLSTLHTNDACGAISRLVEMEVEPFLVASALVGILAQRLARTICPNCKESYVPEATAVRKFGLSYFSDGEIRFHRGRGCDHCKMTGYRGRTGIHEVLPVTDDLRSLILQRASTSQIRQAAIEGGMKTMQDDGLRKTLHGLTSMDECLRVVSVETNL